ncbi:Excinuclease ABC C subunit domain protein [Rippkaea orientalis PCC 8801]|uniref:Excinuclease ABC C subunit domain protein n=1 Tax=Rippkaea orientalis (strain PCC 8801 / RF-1) TaxID=41431 RepID=B7K2Z4_RIPO1|nr:GIY-YIG nuclease family protein [Rippkaea orientalis]ACK67695.1 Excinuclease ABC C subunit domain protein [Rippkaea orientalis PCC 8801]
MMKGDSRIIAFPCVTLKNRDQLPSSSGIYYVLDESNIVWYIGQAKNLQSRWQGKDHHRLFQLASQKKLKFCIYYQSINFDQLDQVETQEISRYNPYLNQTRVKHKTVRPSETLLRETLIKLSGHIVVLGVESPRKEFPYLIEQCQRYKENWWIQKRVLESPVIHLAIDGDRLNQLSDNYKVFHHLTNSLFKSRKNYGNKWEQPPGFKKNPHIAVGQGARLLTNGFAIEISIIYNIQELMNDVKEVELASEKLLALGENGIKQLQETYYKGFLSLAKVTENSINNIQEKSGHLLLSRLTTYCQDLIKLVFNEEIKREELENNSQKILEEYDQGLRGIGSRSGLINYHKE